MKKALPLVCCLTLIASFVTGCNGGADGGAPSSPPESAGVAKDSMNPGGLEASEATGKASSASEANLAFPRKIIFTGELRLVCEDLGVATDKLESRIKEFGGYISTANKSGSRGETRESTWTIRVPSEKFDSFIKFAVSIGELQSDHRQAQDVSEEFYDVAARLRNKKIEEARLIELLKKATGKLSEILTVENEITRVREEIERIEGRLRFLTNQTDLSTITVTITEVKNFQPVGPPTLSTQVSRTFSGSLDSMKQLGIGLLLFLVAVLPWAIVPGLVVLFIYRRTRRREKPEVIIESVEEP